MEVSGYIIRYSSLSRPIPLPNGRKVFERILPGAFADSVAAINGGGAVLKANVEHIQNSALMKLGDTLTNIKVEHRTDGVFVRMNLLDDTVSDDVAKKITAKLVNGASIEFDPAPGIEPAYETTSTGDYIRSWSRLVLKGFAVVDEPMYRDAQLFARSFSAVEHDLIAIEVAAIEQRRHREYESWLLGIR